MVFGGGRNSAIVSHADDRAATFGHEHPHGSPLKALKRMGGKLKHHTAVTTTEEEPGVSDHDRAAGTSVPVAERSKKDALNAGFQPPSSIRDDASIKGGRRSFSSFRSFRSKSSNKNGPSTPKSRITGQDSLTNSPAADGSTSGADNKSQMNSGQVEAMRVAENPQDHLDKAGKDQSAHHNRHEDNKDHRKPRLANTETFYQDSNEQKERERLIREHLQKEEVPSVEDPTKSSESQLSTKDKDGKETVSSEKFSNEPSQRSSAEFVDAPDPSESVVRTVSQPSPEAIGSLSPRNRFVASGSTRGENRKLNSIDGVAGSEVTKVGGDSFVDAKEQSITDSASNSTPRGTSIGAVSSTYAHSTSDSCLSPSQVAHKQFASPRVSRERTRGNESLNEIRPSVNSDGQSSDRHSSEHQSSEQKSAEDDKQFTEAAEQQMDEDEMDPKEDKTVGRKHDEDDMNIPEGSVPGLGIGDYDPKLPGERNEKPKKEEPKSSEDLESEKAKSRFLSEKEEIRRKRERQAEYSGWRQIGGWDKRIRQNTRQEAQTLLEKSTMLESYVSDKYLGDWYQNTALILITALFSWFLGRLHLSVSWLSIVLLFSATAYRTSVRRMRRNYRDDILRESLLDSHDEKDTESMEWLNSFMIKFWLIYEPSLSQMITEIGNEVLAEQTPGFIDSMKIDKFTLGTKAPRIDFVRSFPRTNAQVVVIDMGASFTPNDTIDLTARQLQTKVNPKVQLGVRVGKGFLTKNFPILLEDMNFKGKFRVRLKLMERAPHIQTLDFSFLAPPQFDFVLKPIGGDKLGFDVNIIPGLSKFIKDMVNANLGPMLYAPNAFQVNVEQLMAGVGPMSGVGVLSLQILSADNLKKDADGRVDPYVLVRDKSKKQLAHTKIKANTTSPTWNETINVIISNTNDNVLLEVFDFDESAPDRSIGQTAIKITELLGSEAVTAPITSGGTRTGYLKYIAHYSPVTMPTEDDADNGSSPRDTKSGILSLKVSAARDLDPTISKTAKLSPYAEIEFSGRLIDSTKVSKDTNDPEWNYGAEHIVMDKMSTLFTLRIRDKRSKITSPPQVGLFKMKLSQLLVEAEKGNKWFPLEDGKGEIKIEPQWKPVNITVGGSANNYVEPIGVMRLNIKNAKNLRNLEHIGKIDPYARVFVGHRLVARTDWFKNDLNPVWDEVLYVPIQSELQDMTIEVMDVENRGKDRSLGAFKVDLQNIIKHDEDGNYKVFVSDKTFTNKLMLPNRGPKGTLEYTMEFYPAIPIVSPEERDRMQSDKKLIKLLKDKVSEKGGDIKKALTDDERRELAAREERLDFSGVDMPVEKQLEYKSGVFAIAIVSLEGHRVGQSLKIIANNEPYPMFTSPVFKKSKRYTSEECPDFVSGQMDLSSLRFELGTFNSKSGLSGLVDVSMDEDEDAVAKDPNAAEITIPCFELIREASRESKSYKLKNGAKIELQARYFPLPGLVIDPSEDVSEIGCIEIDLKRAKGVAAADSSGLSDPYCAFYMNNESDKVYKSKIKKATLDPEWNEMFRFAVSDVKNSFVKAIVNDWDMGNRDDFLGGYKFNFSELEPLEWKDYEVHLEKIKKDKEVKHVKEASGTLYLRMRFLPGHLQKSGDGFLVGAASVSRAAGGLVTGAAGAGIGAASGVVGAAAHGPQALFNKITHHGNDNEKLQEAMKSYNAQIESIVGLNGMKYEIQIRCFLLTDKGEKEVYKSQNIKLEHGEATPNYEFSFKSLPECELGIKVVAIKSLGRHSDVAQSSTDLEPGMKEVRLTKDSVLRLSIAQEDST